LNRLIAVLVLAPLLHGCARTQNYTFTKTATFSEGSVVAHEAAFSHSVPIQLPKGRTALDLYRVSYSSKDFFGKPTKLSALLVLPEGGAPKGLVVYYHGTTSDNRYAPSRYTSWDENYEAQDVALTFATGGYAVAMPDYLGLGDSDAVHPYPLGDFNSRSGLDLIAPVRGIAAKQGIALGPKLYITGYSEGGGVAMWAVKHLEEENGEKPAEAAPMSGPYDLSGVTARSVLRAGQGLPDLGIKLFLLGMAAYSAQAYLPGMDLTNYFAPSFASYIPYVFSKPGTDESRGKKLVFKAIEEGAVDSVRKVLTWKFRQAMEKGDSGDPLIALLAKNNCFQWTPHTPMLLPYLTTDTVVPPENTLEAVDAMQKATGPDLVEPFAIENLKLNHISAVPEALVVARLFFDGGFEGVPHDSGLSDR
jgi:pimeloyl-ACP methyl ester carboxylesterase